MDLAGRPAAGLRALVHSGRKSADLVLERRYRTTLLSLLSHPFQKTGMALELHDLGQQVSRSTGQ